jgi:MFS family permease
MNCDEVNSAKKMTGWIICLLYFIIGVSQYFGTSYVSLFIKTFPFIDVSAVGIIMAIQYIIGVAGQLLWGNLADQSKTKNRILFVVLAGIFVTTWFLILPNHQSSSSILLSVIMLNLFLLIPLSLLDTIVVENRKMLGLQFGKMRGFSSVGSAMAAFILFLIAVLASVKIQPKTGLVIMAFSALAALVPLCLVPKTNGHAYGKKGKRMQEIRILLENRRFLLLLLFGLFNSSCTGAYVSYYAIYFTSAEGLGAGLEVLNLYAALCIAGESILIIVSGKLFSKRDIYWIFTWVSVMGAFRSLSAFLAPNPYILMVGGIFQGLMFGPLWGRVAPFIGSLVHDEVYATAQSIWSIVIQGVGPALGAMIGGAASRFVGLRGVFCVIFCLHLLNTFIFLIPFRRQRAMDRVEGVQSI